jgi:hypothetical protein
MTRLGLTAISGAAGALVALIFILMPDVLQTLLSALHMPGTLIDMFSSDSGLRAICGLTAFALLAYGLPLLSHGLSSAYRLRDLMAHIESASDGDRRLADLDAAIAADPHLEQALAPAQRWASDQLDESGSAAVVAHRLPSTLISAAALFRQHQWAPALRVVPLLVIGFGFVITFFSLSRSADRTFSDLISVTPGDYSAMILGFRSSCAGMALAALAGLILWTMQRLLDEEIAALCSQALQRLDRFVDIERQEILLAESPTQPAILARLDGALAEQRTSLANIVTQLTSLREDADSQTHHLSLLPALQEQLQGIEVRHHELKETADRVAAENDSLRKDIAVLKELRPRLQAANEGAVTRLTTALRSLRDSASSSLPGL